MDYALRSKKRQKIENTVEWTRKDIIDIIKTKGSEYNITARSRSGNKAKLLQKEFKPFNNVSLLLIEEWLFEMKKHENRKRNVFKKTYIPLPDDIINAVLNNSNKENKYVYKNIIKEKQNIINLLRDKLNTVVNAHHCLDSVAKQISSKNYTNTLREFINNILLTFTSKSNKDHIIFPGIQRSANLSRCCVFKQDQFHYLEHCVKLCCLLNIPIGYVDEEGLEGFHVICNDCRRSYLNQKGVLRVQYMEKIYLIVRCNIVRCIQMERVINK